MTDSPSTDAPASLYGVPLSDSHGQRVLHPSRAEYVKVVKQLLSDTFTMCSDLTAVDYLTHSGRTLPAGITGERFEVVVNLLSIERRERIRVRVQVPADDATIPSLFDMYPGTEAMEREAYDMFGLVFTDHPDLTRILMPEDWDGFPLRKDYETGRIPVQFTADFPARPEAGAQ
ncbi:MAG: NADH-quinone oxidoreductase subunit [Actinomycetota bacterium]|jgi:NADH-quinone oxidoreductase subunit C